MKTLRIACTGLLSLLSGAGLAAPTIYTYTGAFYDYVALDADPPAGSYTTAMRLTGSITFPEAIAPNSTLVFDHNTPGVSFQFNDGRFDFTNANLGTGFGFSGSLGGSIETDASGGVASWYLGIVRVAPVPDASHAYVSSTPYPGGVGYDDVTLYGFDGVNFVGWDRVGSSMPGSWTVTAVPEPSAYALFVAGIALVGIAAKRRMRLPS